MNRFPQVTPSPTSFISRLDITFAPASPCIRPFSQVPTSTSSSSQQIIANVHTCFYVSTVVSPHRWFSWNWQPFGPILGVYSLETETTTERSLTKAFKAWGLHIWIAIGKDSLVLRLALFNCSKKLLVVESQSLSKEINACVNKDGFQKLHSPWPVYWSWACHCLLF